MQKGSKSTPLQWVIRILILLIFVVAIAISVNRLIEWKQAKSEIGDLQEQKEELEQEQK